MESVALSVTVLYVMSGIVVTVLGLVGGAPGGETPRVADSSAAGAGRFFHNSVLSSRQLARELLARRREAHTS